MLALFRGWASILQYQKCAWRFSGPTSEPTRKLYSMSVLGHRIILLSLNSHSPDLGSSNFALLLRSRFTWRNNDLPPLRTLKEYPTYTQKTVVLVNS